MSLLTKSLKRELLLCLSFLSFTLLAQRGPGGVSLEVAGDSDCKMWCDAGELVLGDGDPVAAWPDISLSADVNTPTQTAVVSQPTYRSAAAESINGNPVLRFLPAQFLQLLSSDDINDQGPYMQRTTFLAFRTGTDITTRQMLWEQGGTVRGLNVYIFDGYLYFGGYDVAGGDPDGTPAWPFTFTRVPVDPSTPYVVTHVFEGPLGATTGTISGFLNGQSFQALNPGVGEGDPAGNVGSLWTHPNPPGLGAINGDSYNELGPIGGGTGSQPFLGDMAEFIAYDELLNDAERIIVENYLGAKYFADLVVNDYFDWQLTHGDEVIGVGRFTGATNLHNVSQGRNVFQIEAPTADFADVDDEFFLVGHNDADITSWTVTDAPNLGINTQRIAREWKVDHTGDVGDIRFTVDATTELPTFPAGFTRLCLVMDLSGGAISNFNSGSVEIIEMIDLGGGIYETTQTVPDGTYITFAVINPAVQFTNSNDFGFELTPVGADALGTVQVELNYRPLTDITVNYTFADVTAVFGAGPPPGVDYNNVTPGTGIVTIPADNYFGNINFDILGDSDPESSEDLRFNLVLGAGTTADLELGATDENTFTIFDDDNTPDVGFAVVASSEPESAGTVNVQIVRSGNIVPPVSVEYRLRIPGGSGTATDGVDYTYVSGIANFASGVTTFDMPVTILEDLLDEPDETIIFELFNSVDCDIIPAQKEHTLTIVDNDSPPEVCFAITTSQGPESFGTPVIEVILSAPSTLVCEIDYQDLLTGTALFPGDYTIATTGTITFAPGDTLETLPLFIVNDVAPEPDETINFELLPGTAVNCTPGACLTHTYTIKDYTSFEWLGVAGIGMPVDNVFWFNADALPDADGANVTDFLDQSPNGQVATQGTGANRPNMNFAGPNGKKELDFNGTTDFFDLDDDPLINTSAFYTRKYVTVVFTTTADVGTRQLIYEQGGGTRGISIYIDGGDLYFHVWSNNDDNGTDSRWGVGSPTGAFFVNGTVDPSATSVATLVYETDGGTGGTLEGFINGASVGTVALSTVAGTQEPRLYSHGDNGGIGDVVGTTRYHDNASGSNPFGGSIQELVHYSDAPFNTTRRIILENHMSVKYDVALAAGAQKYAISYASSHENEIAGIGQFGASDNHSDSQGTGMVRINTPSDLDVGDFLMWGHDGASLTVGLFPYVEYIPGISNRLHRVWKASELAGDVGTVTLAWDLSVIAGFASMVETDLVLLIDSDDGNFSNALQIEAGRSYVPTTGTLTFTGVNLNNDVWFTIGTKTSATPLPIELLEFTATPVENDVRLNWTTLSETENDFFTIERSRDGIAFTELMKVPGAGNSSIELNYEEWDNNPLPGISYYRLKQTDFNGTTSYSDIVSVEFDGPKLSIYPNPAADLINVQTNLDDSYAVYVFDIQGKLIRTWEEGDQAFKMDVSTLESGIYYMNIISENESVTKQFVVN